MLKEKSNTNLSTTFSEKVINDRALYNAHFDQITPAIDHILYDGVTVLGGAPKSGKSILVEQMAYDVATGNPLFGNGAHQGEVLYLNLESDPANALARRKAMHMPPTDHINYYFGPQVGLSDVGTVAQKANAKQKLQLIIVDTLQKIRGCNKTADEYSYQEAVRDIDVLQTISKDINVPILVVHHTKKDSDSLLGSQGIFATVSSKLIVLREEAAKAGQLSIVSRFHPSHSLNLKFQEAPLGWVLDDEERGPVTIDPIISAIMAFLARQENETWEGTMKELWRDAGLATHAVDPTRLSRHINNHFTDFERNHISYHKKRSKSKRTIQLIWKD
ncbi:AAA family ATPase [Eubacterium aggregans]|uniref:AAA family ATPase n=1 Tax=Eubacterium aggregans TaxID=81409 RepID=UPI003F35BF9B